MVFRAVIAAVMEPNFFRDAALRVDAFTKAPTCHQRLPSLEAERDGEDFASN